MLASLHWTKHAAAIGCLVLQGCAGSGLQPGVDDRNVVSTPVFADNRVYYLKKRDAKTKRQALEPLGARQTGQRLGFSTISARTDHLLIRV